MPGVSEEQRGAAGTERRDREDMEGNVVRRRGGGGSRQGGGHSKCPPFRISGSQGCPRAHSFPGPRNTSARRGWHSNLQRARLSLRGSEPPGAIAPFTAEQLSAEMSHSQPEEEAPQLRGPSCRPCQAPSVPMPRPPPYQGPPKYQSEARPLELGLGSDQQQAVPQHLWNIDGGQGDRDITGR